MVDDVLINKAEIIERAKKRIFSKYKKGITDLEKDYDAQDIVLLNLERICQASIDMAMRIVRIKKWGIPRDSRESFEILENNKFINKELSNNLIKMTGFRNIAVHEYQSLDMSIVEAVINEKLSEIDSFVSISLKTEF